MKESHKMGENKFLNSLKIFFKRIILKSNYLLNEQTENINAYEINSSKINHIKKYLFEYPIIKDINNINDSTELNFLISINNNLVKNLEIKNIDINSWNIFELNKKLVSSLKDIFLDEEELDDDDNAENNDITDEKYYKRKKK
jgi:hypothetical protein